MVNHTGFTSVVWGWVGGFPGVSGAPVEAIVGAAISGRNRTTDRIIDPSSGDIAGRAERDPGVAPMAQRRA
ncbi:hypothetical protein GCM10023068_09620 [Leifsonia shinshuensis]